MSVRTSLERSWWLEEIIEEIINKINAKKEIIPVCRPVTPYKPSVKFIFETNSEMNAQTTNKNEATVTWIYGADNNSFLQLKHKKNPMKPKTKMEMNLGILTGSCE
jgi:hypothetical protein